MNIFKGNGKYFLIGIALLVFIGIVLFIIYHNTKTPSTNNINKTTHTDDSDCPQPPNTLEYNRTLAPPKRNNNIVNACAAGLPQKRYDKVNGFYFTLPGDLPL